MIASLEQMTEFLERARQLPVERLFFAEPQPEPETWIYMHPCFRFIQPMTGEKEVRYAAGGRIGTRLFHPGEVIIGCPGAWIDELWNHGHEMISVVFFEKYVRALYIGHDGLRPPQKGPDVFFHTVRPADAAMHATIQALLAAGSDSRAARLNLRALLEMVVELLYRERETHVSEEELLWNRVFDYLQYTFCNDISREDVAAGAGIHPARLSRLVRSRTGLAVREYLNRMRLEYAVQLLRESRLPVEEIAVQCGFNYPSYFIRLFRRRYRISPGEFRRRKDGGIPAAASPHV